MNKEYMKLYKDCLASASFFDDAHFVAIKGENYSQNNDFRFMLIGRAPNGWSQINAKSQELFGREAEKQFQDINKQRWNWIKEKNGKLYSVNEENGNIYSLERSAFWTYSREIFNYLCDSGCKNLIWQKNIVWSNLYKVAPRDAGNPSSKSQKIQLNASKEILKKELEEFCPTHILIMSGFDFFEPFSELFDKVYDMQKRNKSSSRDFIEGIAQYETAKVVIACRPEGRVRKAYVTEVLEEFNR